MAQDPSGSSKDSKDKQKGEPAPPASRQSAGGAPPASSQAGPAGVPIDPEQLKQILQALASAGGLPITVAQAPLSPVELRPRLDQLPPVTVAFPPCSDVLLALIKTQTAPKDDITKFCEEYFTFDQHQTVFVFRTHPSSRFWTVAF